MPNPTVSWVVLTYNRCESVRKAITHCMEYAGEKWDELVWVDNGSVDGVRDFMRSLKPDVTILNKENLGVAKGYNRGLALSSCDYVVITGCDMLMPDGWLRTFKEYVRRIPQTGVACIYSGPLSWVPERARKGTPEELWKRETLNGLDIVHAMPIGRRILSRRLLMEIGFFHEGFGLYGWDDVVWGHRAEKICDEKGLLYYVIPDQIAEHLGTEGVMMFDGKDDFDYHAFKKKEADDRNKHKLMAELSRQGWPYFNPYA